jgi:hypothetical protein
MLEALNTQVGTLNLTRTSKNVVRGDKLLPNEASRISSVFYPSNPEGVKPGRIIRIFDSIGSGAQYNVMVINRGEKDGVKSGHTFAIYRQGAVIQDTVKGDTLRLPSERAGLAMVFRTFKRVSYILVLRSATTIKTGDEVRPPISGD